MKIFLLVMTLVNLVLLLSVIYYWHKLNNEEYEEWIYENY